MLQPVTSPEEFNKHAHHIVQSWQWGEFRKLTPTVKKVLRLGSYPDNKLTRTFEIFFHHNPNIDKIRGAPNCVAYLPRCQAPTREEIKDIEIVCKKEGAVYLTLEPTSETSYPLPKGQPILPKHTILIDLSQPEEELLHAMHEKTRYNLGLAQRKGVSVQEGKTNDDLEEFIKLLRLTESRQGFYSKYGDYYRLLWKTLRPSDMVTLLIANAPSVKEPIAAIMLFKFKDYLYYPYGGSDPKYREYMAPTLLHWEAIKYGKQLGCKTYDLWGSYKNDPQENDPWWGIYRFKKGFGGTEKSFPTYEIPFNMAWYHAYKTGNTLRWAMLRALRKLEF